MSNLTVLEPGLARLCAPNPSPMTYTGTNTYLLGSGPVAVIDPGPDDEDHLRAILRAAGQGVSHILVTHAHLDHSPLARRLSAETGAPVLAFGSASAGRTTVMDDLDRLGGGEGVDAAFIPDRCLDDAERIDGAGWSLTAIWTPGHFGNHMCFAWGDTLFSGDLVMGWASTMISPPDGDVGQFMRSCARLRDGGWRRFFPGHGAPVETPAARIDWLLDHRRHREVQIVDVLQRRPATARAITREIYDDIPPALHAAATRNVLAHLIDLNDNNRAGVRWRNRPRHTGRSNLKNPPTPLARFRTPCYTRPRCSGVAQR